MSNIDEYGEIIEKNNNSVRKRGKNKNEYILFFLILFIAFALYLTSNKQIFNNNQNTNKVYVSKKVSNNDNISLEWQKTFGGSDSDQAHSLIQTTDGGYAVAGETRSYGAGGSDFWVIKLNSDGRKEWEKTFGGSNHDSAYSLIQTIDGGYALTGDTDSFGADCSDFWVIKLNSDGRKEWQKTFGGSHCDRAHSLIQTTDGGYAVAGITYSCYSCGAGGRDFWVIKLNSDGRKEWEKTFGGGDHDWAYSLIQTIDGGYALAGQKGSYGAGGLDFWVIKLNGNGKKEWEKTFGGSHCDWADSLIQTTDGGYAVAGTTCSYGAGGSDFWVIKLNSDGRKEWQKTFGGSDSDQAHSLIQTTDGGYAVAGTTCSYGAGNWDFLVIKLDGNGKKEWEKTFGGGDDDWADSLIQTTDGGYALAGGTRSYGAGKLDFWVIKLDKKNNLR
jgi:uncharacterized delta-60 repeat protein